jgi:hypothetical protein
VHPGYAAVRAIGCSHGEIICGLRPAGSAGELGKEGKVFFFEKKNQKNFCHFGSEQPTLGAK